jgi:hypothetical protein
MALNSRMPSSVLSLPALPPVQDNGRSPGEPDRSSPSYPDLVDRISYHALGYDEFLLRKVGAGFPCPCALSSATAFTPCLIRHCARRSTCSRRRSGWCGPSSVPCARAPGRFAGCRNVGARSRARESLGPPPFGDWEQGRGSASVESGDAYDDGGALIPVCPFADRRMKGVKNGQGHGTAYRTHGE